MRHVRLRLDRTGIGAGRLQGCTRSLRIAYILESGHFKAVHSDFAEESK
jgi:hypothetical protein